MVEVCPVANSRLWPRLAGSIHRRALRDRFTNPALPTPTPTPLSRLYLSPATASSSARATFAHVYVYPPDNPPSHIDRPARRASNSPRARYRTCLVDRIPKVSFDFSILRRASYANTRLRGCSRNLETRSKTDAYANLR